MSSSQRRVYLSPRSGAERSQTPSQAPTPSPSSPALLEETTTDEEDHHHHQDPYNRPDLYQQQQQPHYVHLGELEQQQQQYAYDSMSTILEVDSEASDESTELRAHHQRRLYDSPLVVRTQPMPEPGRVSPVGQAEFSGTLSALAQQVERLRRSSISRPSSATLERPPAAATSPKSPATEDSVTHGRFHEAASSITSSSSSSSRASDTTNSKSSSSEPSTSSDRSELLRSSGSSGAHQISGQLAQQSEPRPGSSASHHHLHQAPLASFTRLSPDQQVSLGSRSPAASTPRPNLASRTNSAESLMMITVSPMASPKIKFPLLRSRRADSQHNLDDDGSGQRRLVEVSNKSTITAIDLALMDKMVQKYFVDTREKATQSIEFDCADEQQEPRSRLITGKRPGSKSVAVGTEKFSRERFSLLPPTTTRSTQTKPNLSDHDIGTSETRRYKLSHGLFEPVKRRQQQQVDTSELGESRTLPVEAAAQTDSVISAEATGASGPGEGGDRWGGRQQGTSPERAKLETREASQRSRPTTPARLTTEPQRRVESATGSGKTTIEAKGPEVAPGPQVKRVLTPSRQVQSATPERDSLVGSPEIREKQLGGGGKATAGQTPQSSDSLSSSQEQVTGGQRRPTSADSEHIKAADSATSSSGQEEDSSPESAADETPESSGFNSQRSDSLREKGPGKAKTPDGAPSGLAEKGAAHAPTQLQESTPQSRATIPSLRTELRVIIEFQDSRQRQRSEVTSNSQLTSDGKLSKRTEVSTSKQVAVSPRQVLERLQSIGREHSLLYQPLGGGRQPQQVAAAGTPPAAVAAANQSALRSLARPHSNEGSPSGETPTSGGRWREVSRSSVRNEIETDTRKRPKRSSRAKQQQQQQLEEEQVKSPMGEDIVISSDATINHSLGPRADQDSAIELRSRAVRRRESLERDPRSGRLVRSGRVTERTLVESEAAFDGNSPPADRKPEARLEASREQPEVVRVPSRADTRLGVDGLQQTRNKTAASPSQGGVGQLVDGGREQVSRNRSTPGSPAPPRSPSVQPANSPPAAGPKPRSARLEIDEHREDRRQVTKNGQVIFDDRLRERRFETQRGALSDSQRQQQWAWRSPVPPGTPLKPTMLQFQQSPGGGGPTARSASLSPRSPLSPGAGILLRPASRSDGRAQQQQQTASSSSQRPLLKPISLPTSEAHSPPILFADQTSNLSSDPETMDSGFAQSGVGGGSGSALNQQHQQQPRLQQARAANWSHGGSGQQPNQDWQTPEGAGPRKNPTQARGIMRVDQDQLEQPESLNFVDDDVDELIDQLDNSRMLSPRPANAAGQQQRTARQDAGERPKTPNLRRTPTSTASTSQSSPRMSLISPPPAFCSSEPALNKLTESATRQRSGQVRAKPTSSRPPTSDTSLTTKLTRSKRQPEVIPAGGSGRGDRRRTQTRLEQSLVAPQGGGSGGGRAPRAEQQGQEPAGGRLCRFKAQVMFESDTDSMSTERHSVASSRAGPKELVSETKFSRGAHGQSPGGAGREPRGQAQVSAGQAVGSSPAWDYSLRVNRMRGSQVDSKVSTYIKHSRKPLINSEAS